MEKPQLPAHARVAKTVGNDLMVLSGLLIILRMIFDC